MSGEHTYRALVTAEDVTEGVLACVRDCVDWFDDSPTMPTEEFIDRLCVSYGSDFDLESYDNEAARKIMRAARQERSART
jgi:hypothetical protein